ncbi:coiled-coil domain-containing protein 138-like isoform X3 [Simochromis diagramma]|uniref:coiled-coil domain-containing protein 138-like isoform X3 n=1 Tax=Simochromis diagramma TaxID=43689 RepID=UPI001A7EB176|nr:coiled-coil domain-containing protein 138-like isoform X3 [Simochromis diagramma]
MNQHFKDADLNNTVEKPGQQYLERRKQVLPPKGTTTGTSDDFAQRLVLTGGSKELKCYNRALHELFKAVANHPEQHSCSLHGNNEDLSADSTVVPLQESQVLFTETDVTLPSYLDGSSGSQEAESDRELQWDFQFPNSCDSSSFALVKIYHEMMTIHKQLKAERQNQQQRERELHERERRLKRQEEALLKLAGMKEMVHSRIVTIEEKHQHELSRLQDLLRERNKENKRLKSNFETIKELNDNMKKQLNEISERNKRLESKSKRVQARLENLQGSVTPSPLKLMAFLLEWVLDVTENKVEGVGRCSEVLLSERCLKVLPLLADQLHHTPLSEPKLLLNLLRLIYSALRHLDNSRQHVAPSATLQWIGEEVSKPAEDSDHPMKCSEAAGSWPLYRSLCPHTRILSVLIIFSTITQADVLSQALESLYIELMNEENRGLFIHYGGVQRLLSVLQGSRTGLNMPIDILMKLSEESCYLNSFLDACSCEEFFQTSFLLLKNPHLDLPSLEKFSILLQKLSNIRKNHHLFELSSLHLQIEELHHKTKNTHAFLCLNLRSILHNIK